MLRAILFDLDGTLTPVRSVWRHLHERLGLWETAARRHQEAFRSGAIDYAEFCRRDAAHWKGLAESDLRALADAIPYRPGAREAVAEARRAGVRVGVISTGLTLLADRVLCELDLDASIANRLLTVDGRLTGEVEVNVEHGGKGTAVERLCRRWGIDPAETASVGDSDGDVSMFARTGWSIAFQPESRATADAATYVHHGDSILEAIRRLPLARREGAA